MHFFCRRKGVVTAVDGIDHLTGKVYESLGRHSILEGYGLAGIGMLTHCSYKRNAGKHGHGVFGRDGIDIGVGAFRE